MTRHFRFRKDIILSIIIVVIFGFGLYYLHHFINLQPQLADSAFMICLCASCANLCPAGAGHLTPYDVDL
jgi:uncharacterized membrane protein